MKLDHLELPPLDRIKELLDYNPESGLFTRAIRAGKCTPGNVAGTMSGGYISIGIDFGCYRAHRLAYYYMTGEDPGAFEIDHINGDTTDNRFCNLRLSSRPQNAQNCKKPNTNRTGVKGVYFDSRRNKYASEIICNGIKYRLGRFDTLELAAAAYNEASAALHRQFRRTEG